MSADVKPKYDFIRAIGSQVQHSVYYRKRFEGWVETLEEDGAGRARIKRTYAGPYFRQALPDGRRCLLRFAYPAFYALSSVAFVYASARRTPSNGSPYVQLVCFAVVMALIALGLFLVSYVKAPKRMTQWEHFAGPARVRSASLAAAGLMAAEIPAVVAALLSSPAGFSADELVNVAAYAAAAAAMLAIHLIERRIRYEETPNEAAPPRGGYYIDL